MADPILTPTATVIAPLIDAIVSARPNALGPMNAGGRYRAVPILASAQTDVCMARVADEVKSARLRFATGTSLRVLAQSEFNTSLPAAPQTAYATVRLCRSSGSLPPGVIRKGQQFAKQANPNASPLPVAAATYAATSTVYVPAGSTCAVVQLTAASAGDDPNVPNFSSPIGTISGFSQPDVGDTATPTVLSGPIGLLSIGQVLSVVGGGLYALSAISGSQLTLTNLGDQTNVASGSPIASGAPFSISNTQIQPSDPVFDSNFQTAFCESSGGSAGLTDPILVAAARATATGQYGPTDGALVAGALGLQSVRFYAFFRASASVAYAQAYVADETWSSGQFWTNLVAQTIASNWLGFGCRVRFGTIVNELVAATATIVLKSSDDLNDTSDIDSAISAQLRSYFDGLPTGTSGQGRQDWYSFRLSTIQAVISGADPRILQCSDVVVSDANTGAVLSEPPSTFGEVWSPTLTHYYVGASADGSDNTFTGTYLPPS